MVGERRPHREVVAAAGRAQPECVRRPRAARYRCRETVGLWAGDCEVHDSTLTAPVRRALKQLDLAARVVEARVIEEYVFQPQRSEVLNFHVDREMQAAKPLISCRTHVGYEL